MTAKLVAQFSNGLITFLLLIHPCGKLLLLSAKTGLF